MPVTSTNPTYDNNIEQWIKCRDVINGNPSIKKAGDLYLPRLSTQEDTEYEAYKTRALFFEATKRTLQGLIGMLFRNDPIIEYPHEEELERVGSGEENIYTFIQKTSAEVLSTGRCGVLVDLPSEETNILPYLFRYPAESIINWKTSKKEGVEFLTMVVLKEKYVEEGKDDFEVEEKTRYRVLRLLEDNVYIQEIYIKETKVGKEEWVLINTITPHKHGVSLDFIPFLFITPSGNSFDVEDPPLLSLCEVNLSHYRSSADLEHGRHFTALPTAWVAGFPADLILKIGSTTAWVSSDPKANAGFLEYTGQGLGAIENALKEKHEMMVILGARILEQSKTFVETNETHQIRKVGEDSILSFMAESLSKSFTKLLIWRREWLYGVNSKTISIEINKDYIPQGIDSNKLNALTESWLKGAFSFDTLFYNLKKGELIPEGVDEEQERQKILSDGDLRGLNLESLDEED